MSRHRSRRSHARSDVVRLLRNGMEGVVLAIAALTPWAFGGVDPVFELAIAAALAVLLALWAALAIAAGRFTIVRCPVSLTLALIFVVGLLQLVPLPAGLLGWVSPGTADLRAELYPAQPEQLTSTEAAAGAPAWPTVSVYPHATRGELFRWLAVLVLFVVVRNQVATTGSLWRLSLVMLVNGCLLALFGLAQFFSDRLNPKIYWTFPTGGHAFGPFINRNHFAAYINLCVGLGVGVLVWLGPTEQDRKRRYMVKPNAPTEQGAEMASVFSPFEVLNSPPQLWTLVGVALMIAAVICSLSRGGVATLLLALLITACLRLTWPLRVRRLEVLLVPVLLIAGLFAWLGFKPLETRLGSALKGTEALADNRLRLWANLATQIPRFPLLGSGYGTLGYVEPLTREAGTFDETPFFATTLDHAHNDYLEALIEGGVLRGGLTVVLVGLVFVAGVRAMKRYSGRTPGALAVGTMVGFLAIALHSAVDFSITTPAVAALAAVVVAHLLSLGRSDPTKPAAAAKGRVVSLRLGAVGTPVVAIAALAVGGVLVLHAWQADRAHRYRLAAHRAVPRGKVADYEQAVNFLEAAARVAPGDADVHSDLGQAYLDRGQEVREHFVDELRRWDQVGLTGLALFSPGPVPAAATMAAWREVPRPDPARLSAARRKETYQDSVLPALRHFAMARRLCPLLPRPHMRFAAHAGEMVSHDPPDKYWERALTLAPFDPDLWYFAGVQLLHEGRAEEAWSDWRKSLELTPKPKYDHQVRKYHDRLAAIIAATGGRSRPSDADARRRAELLLKSVLPNRPDDLVEAAKLIDPQFTPDGPARPLLDRALTLLAAPPEGLTGEDYFLKGQIHEALHEDDDAIRAYKHALTYAASRPEWRRQLVKLLMSRARWKEAQAELPALLRAIPDSQEVKEWIAEVDRELSIQ